MSYFRRVELNNRPKKFFNSSNMTKQYLFQSSNTSGGGGGGGGGGSTDEPESFFYFIEFDYNESVKRSIDFLSAQSIAIQDLGFDTSQLILSTGVAFETGTIVRNFSTRVKVSNIFSSGQDKFEETNEKILELKEKIKNEELLFSFTDFKTNNTVIAEARLSLEGDLMHDMVYRYNQVYTFGGNNENKFKLVKASIDDDDNDDAPATVNTGDKVYVADNNENYLICDLNDDRTAYIDGEIKWSTEPQYRLLFEVHGFNNQDMLDTHAIISSHPIPNDYGFKLEILPPNIQGVFNGLSNFVDGYVFEDDGDYTLIDNDVAGFNVSHFYEEDLGTRIPTDDPEIPNVDYDIDECFLTFNNGIYGFTFNNNFDESKTFFNATKF
jgi:hypothetical protein